EERGPRKSVIGVRIAAPSAGVAQREEQAHGKRPTAVRGCGQLQEFCWSSTVGVQRACTSPTSVRFTRPAPDVLWRDWRNGVGAGLWLQSREFDSLISPQMGGSYEGITHGLQP